MPPEQIPVVEQILSANDAAAARNRALLDAHGVHGINVMASPGAGKTSILEGTLEALRGSSVRAAVLTGDIQTERDADRLRRHGFPALQITTGGTCHLDAAMVRRALDSLPLDGIDVLFIENVGNLVCPASYDLGEDVKVVVLSVTEGDDKPLKYPGIFRRAGLMLLHKMDLLPHARFDPAAAVADARRVQPDLEVVETSCYGAPGLGAWIAWVQRRLEAKRAAEPHAQP